MLLHEEKSKSMANKISFTQASSKQSKKVFSQSLYRDDVVDRPSLTETSASGGLRLEDSVSILGETTD